MEKNQFNFQINVNGELIDVNEWENNHINAFYELKDRANELRNNKYKTEKKEIDLLPNVIGLDIQKEELLNVLKWFNNSKELRKKGVSIPKGVIMFGEPGNGKSLLMKEIIKLAKCPVFIFEGQDTNIVEGIIDMFAKARKAGHSIIVIDELDLLIDKENRVVRALQENLDGVESSDDILVLTATNDLSGIPPALRRNGRLEKIIHIPYPNAKEAIKLLKLNFENFGVKLPEDFDEEEVGLSLHRVSCASIKAIVNDVVLRNGFENITNQMIDDSIYNVTERIKHTPEDDTIQVATHEAGHAVMASKFKDLFFINKLNIDGGDGYFTVKEINESNHSYSKSIASIQIAMAGTIAERLIFGEGSNGCERDLEGARKRAYNLFNKAGYSSCWETLPNIDLEEETRRETFIKRRKMERKIEKFLRHYEKLTYKYLSKNIDKVEKLGKLLFEKKHLKSKEILECLGNNA